MQCANNLKQIVLALRNYETDYGSLPPAYTVDLKGNRLHSWRTLILPYLDQERLYDSIDLAKPWNDPVNRKAYDTMVHSYQCPAHFRPTSSTAYLAVVAPNGCFLGKTPRRLDEITADHAQTLMVVEVDDSRVVHWMSPTDADETLLLQVLTQAGTPHPGGCGAAFVDGHVQFLTQLKPERIRALISIDRNDDKLATERDQ